MLIPLAHTAYLEALEAINKTYSTALAAYSTGVSNARSNLDGTLAAIDAAYQDVLDAHNSDPQNNPAPVESYYQGQRDAAQENYESTVADLAEDLEEARIVHRNATADASLNYSNGVSAMQLAHHIAIANAQQIRAKADSDQSKTHSVSMLNASKEYGLKSIEADKNDKLKQIAAAAERGRRQATADRNYSVAIAAAKKTQADAVAAAEAAREAGLDAAEHTRTVAEANARLAAALDAHEEEDNPSTRYELALATANKAKVEALIAAENKHSSSLVSANLSRSNASAAAELVFKTEVADAEKVYQQSMASKSEETKSDFASDVADTRTSITTEENNRNVATAGVDNNYQKKIADLDREHSVTVAEKGDTSSQSMNSATHKEAREEISGNEANALRTQAQTKFSFDSYQATAKRLGGLTSVPNPPAANEEPAPVTLGGVYGENHTSSTERRNLGMELYNKVAAKERKLVQDTADNVNKAEKALNEFERARSWAKVIASSKREVAEINAAKTYAHAMAEASNTYAKDEAGAEATYGKSEADAYQTFMIDTSTEYAEKMEDWSENEDTHWATYLTALADVEKAAGIAQANADHAEALRLVEVDRKFALDTASAEYALSVAEVDAAIASQLTTATKTQTKLESQNTAQETWIKAISDAIANHDKNVVEHNETFAKVENETRKVIQDGNSSAWWGYHVRMIPIYYFPPLAIMDYAAAWGSGTESFQHSFLIASRKAEAKAEVENAHQFADARKARAQAVGQERSTLVSSYGTAHRTFVSANYGAEVTFANSMADAQETYLGALGIARETFLTTQGRNLRTAIKSSADSDEQLAHDVASLSETAMVDAEEALATYEMDRDSAHAAKVAAWAAIEDTPGAYYEAAIATADSAWTTSVSTAHITHATTMAAAEAAASKAFAAADKVYAYAEADADFTRATAVAGAERAAQNELAIALSKKIKDEALNVRNHQIKLVEADQTYNNKVSELQLDFDLAAATAGVTYVNAVKEKRGEWHIAGQTEEASETYALFAAFKSIDKNKAVMQANKGRVEDIGDARVEWAGFVGDADKAYADKAAEIARDFVVATATATVNAATTDKNAKTAHGASISNAAAAQLRSYSTASRDYEVAAVTADKTLVGAIGTADITLAEEVSVAKGDFDTALATELAADALAHALVTQEPSDFFAADQAAAHAAWTIAVAPAFTTYAKDLATAGAKAEDLFAAAELTLTQAEEGAQVTFIDKLATSFATESAKIAAARATQEAATRILPTEHETSLANAKIASVGVSAIAQKGFAIAQASAWKEHAVTIATKLHEQAEASGTSNPISGGALSQSIAAANTKLQHDGADNHYALMLANAGAERDYQKTGAVAEGAYITAMAAADKALADVQVTSWRDFRLAVADARKTRDDALSVASHTYLDAAAQIIRDEVAESATAESTAIIAQYTQTHITQQNLSSWNLPWVDYQIALAAAESAWATVIAPRYAEYVTAVADAQLTRDKADSAALEVNDKAYNTANKSYADTIATADYTNDTTLHAAVLARVQAVSAAQVNADKALADHRYNYSADSLELGRDDAKGLLTNSGEQYEALYKQLQQNEHVVNVGFSNAAGAAERTYQITAATAAKDLAVANFTADRDWTVATADADETYGVKMANSQYDYEEVMATEWKDYRLESAETYASEMAALALSDGSPWAIAQDETAQAELAKLEEAAPADEANQLELADANRDKNIAEIEANADSTRDQVEANYTFQVAKATAEFDNGIGHILFGTRPENFGAVRLHTLGIGNALLAAEGAAVGAPAEYIEMLHGKSGVGVTTADHLGDGYYDGVIGSMRFTSYSYEQTDYSNPFYAWVGENLRNTVGDDALAEASDTTLFVGTVAFSAALVASVYFAPAAALSAGATGAGMGFVIDVGFQVAANYDAGESLFKIDFSRAANSAAVGGFLGVAMAGAGAGLSTLGRMFPTVCRVATPLVNTAMRGAAAYQVYSGVQQIRQGNVATGALTASLGVFGLFAKGASFCFIAGTLVLRQRLAANVAFVQVELPPEERETANAGALSRSNLTTFGCTVLVIGVVTQRVLSRRMDEEEEEAIRARALEEAMREEMNEHEESVSFDEPHTRSGYDFATDQVLGETAGRKVTVHPTFDYDVISEETSPPEPLSFDAASGSRESVACTLTRASLRRRKARPIAVANPQRTAAKSWRLWGFVTAALLLLGLAGSWMFLGGTHGESEFADSEYVMLEEDFEYLTTPIEELQPGDYVLAMNTETGEVKEKPIVDVMVRTAHALRILTVTDEAGNEQIFQTTDEHPFWVTELNAFLPAGDLHPGHHFLGPDGQVSTLTATRAEVHPEGVQVYNFEVEDSHTYFVVTTDDGEPVLVHNATKAAGCKDANGRWHNKNGKFGKTRGRPPIVDSTHANSLSTKKPAIGYTLRDRSTKTIKKYGETTQGKNRYSDKYLKDNNVDFVPETEGTKLEMHEWQHQKIVAYRKRYGHRPKLNKSDY